MSDCSTVIVFSHLRWKFVYQRPQHLLTRLAKTHRVLFVEEPVYDGESTPHLQMHDVAENVTICEVHTSEAEPGFNGAQNALISEHLREALKSQGIKDYALWFYSPMAVSIAEDLDPQLVIYDCMDELSSFAHAPGGITECEQQLIEIADIVFTGGPSLYETKKDRHPHVFCFPSSVDASHFGQARLATQEATEQRDLRHPRLGFFGVIDERFDVPLLEYLAKQRPQWQFVLVGPVVKIDPNTLPKMPNIHYLGQQSYDDLPKFLSGWDVCLLPFARNESTKFISPTKTLEYMAAERMIVSTPIKDVAKPYSDIVFLGDTPEQFLEACENAMAVADADRSRRIGRMRQVLGATSWDSTAEQMVAAMEEAKTRRTTNSTQREAAREEPARTSSHRDFALGTNGRPTEPAVNRIAAPSCEGVPLHPVVVIGAGPTGLSATYHLGDEALLLEANQSVGGWCRSIEVDGFTFDYAGHIMFSNDPYVHSMYETLLGDNVHWQDREAWVYSKNVFTRYPFQGALYGLPAEVITECIVGAVEARYGVEQKIGAGNSSVQASAKPIHRNGIQRNGVVKRLKGEEINSGASEDGERLRAQKCENGHAVTDCCADGVLESTTSLAHQNGSEASRREPANFEEFIYSVWGRGIAKHFAIPYNQKLWAVPLKEMETSWLGGRVPMPDLAEMIEGAIKPVAKPMGPNARFGYPLRGGFQSLMNGFLPYIKNQLMLGAKVKSISPSNRLITLCDGQQIGYETLISTMPLPALINAMGAEAPVNVRDAATGLRNVSVRCVNIGVGRERITDKHWIYYPEDTVFHRIFVQGNASPHCNPIGGFGLTCEITYSPHKPLPCEGDDLVRRCIDDCIKVGIIDKDDSILTAVQCDMPYAYVVYDHQRPANIKTIRDWLDTQGIILAGRYSEWEYYNSDHAFLAGRKAAEKARAVRGERQAAETSLN